MKRKGGDGGRGERQTAGLNTCVVTLSQNASKRNRLRMKIKAKCLRNDKLPSPAFREIRSDFIRDNIITYTLHNHSDKSTMQNSCVVKAVTDSTQATESACCKHQQHCFQSAIYSFYTCISLKDQKTQNSWIFF